MHFVILLVTILTSLNILANGQGVFLEINNYLKDNIYIERTRSQCVSKLENIPSNKLNKYNKIYLEAKNGVFDGCLFKSSMISFNIYKKLNNNKQLLASYDLLISAPQGSNITANIKNKIYQYTNQTYLHTNISGDQDIISLAISPKLDNWMQQSEFYIKNKQLNQVYLPGTHDSATYNLNKNSSFSQDCDSTLRSFGDLAKPIIANWSKTQTQDIYTQLTHGIRYLDFRICGDINNLYLCHHLQETSLKNSIEQIKKFIQQGNHNKEIIILDLNHWYPSNGYNKEQIARSALNYIKKELNPWLASRAKFSAKSYIKDFWKQNKTVIIASSEIPDYYDFSVVWRSTNTSDFENCNRNNIDLCSLWLDKNNKHDLLISIDNAINFYNNKNHDYLKVLQLVATPDKKNIIDAIINPIKNPDDLKKFTKKYKFDVSNKIRNLNSDNFNNGLILIEDFTNGLDLSQIAIEKNHVN